MNQPFPTLRDPAPLAAPQAVTAELLDFAAAERERAAWNRLVAEAAYPNPHFSHRVIGAHVKHGLAGPGLRLLVVREGPCWRALLPLVDGWVGWRRRPQAFTSPFITNATPLLSRDGLAENADALVAALGAIAPVCRLPSLSVESKAGRAILGACARADLPTEEVSRFERAVLERRSSYEAYAASHLSANRRKGLRRQRARLDELGSVELRSVEAGEGLRAAIDTFLDLEARGWKGAGGTALVSRPRTPAFARAWFTDAPGPVRPRADMLLLDGRPIAISLALLCGGTAHLLKTAYDENLRAYGPGLLLEDAIVRACHAGFAERLDSAALAGHVLDTLYPDRERIADLLIGAAGQEHTVRRIAGAERRRRALLDRAKGVYGQLKRLRPRRATPH